MIKQCAICGRKFECYDEPNKSHGRYYYIKTKRPSNVLTCSKECSKKYTKLMEGKKI